MSANTSSFCRASCLQRPPPPKKEEIFFLSEAYDGDAARVQAEVEFLSFNFSIIKQSLLKCRQGGRCRPALML